MDNRTGVCIDYTCHLLDLSDDFVDLYDARRLDFHGTIIQAMQKQGPRNFNTIALSKIVAELQNVFRLELQKHQSVHHIPFL
jgi:hypothetical protein